LVISGTIFPGNLLTGRKHLSIQYKTLTNCPSENTSQQHRTYLHQHNIRHISQNSYILTSTF